MSFEVPGCMEIPLALDRVLSDEDIDGAFCLGIIEKGETDHGLVMGQGVVKTILELQLVHNKPIGLGIIGPGALPEHVSPRIGLMQQLQSMHYARSSMSDWFRLCRTHTTKLRR